MIKSETNLELANIICKNSIDSKTVVANGSSTRIYQKNSFWGRFWSVIHYFKGTHDIALAKVIRSTADGLRLLATDRLRLCALVEAEGALGDFWKRHTVTEIKAEVASHMYISYKFHPNTNEFSNLLSAVRWADSKLNQSNTDLSFEQDLSVLKNLHSLENIVKVGSKVEKAEEIEQKWALLGGHQIAPIGVLFRELVSNYPHDNEGLFQKRDQLQQKLGYCLGGQGWGWAKAKCPPELLYGPIVNIAYSLGKQQKHELSVFGDFFDTLSVGVSTEKRQLMQATAAKVIKIAQFFKDPTQSDVLENIPDIIKKKLKDNEYVKASHLFQTKATEPSDCCKVGGGTTIKLLSIPYSYGSTYQRYHFLPIETTIPFQHRRDYYQYEKSLDGVEKLGIFETLSPTAD